MDLGLTGKRALVLGSSKGLGHGIAEQAPDRGRGVDHRAAPVVGGCTGHGQEGGGDQPAAAALGDADGLAPADEEVAGVAGGGEERVVEHRRTLGRRTA